MLNFFFHVTHAGIFTVSFFCSVFILSFFKPMVWTLYTGSALVGIGAAGEQNSGYLLMPVVDLVMFHMHVCLLIKNHSSFCTHAGKHNYHIISLVEGAVCKSISMECYIYLYMTLFLYLWLWCWFSVRQGHAPCE